MYGRTRTGGWTFYGAHAYRTATQSIVIATWTKISFDTSIFDYGAMFVPTSTDITIVAAGTYYVSASCRYTGAAAVSEQIGVRVLQNGTVVATQLIPDLNAAALRNIPRVSIAMICAAGDIITAETYRSGATANIDDAEPRANALQVVLIHTGVRAASS